MAPTSYLNQKSRRQSRLLLLLQPQLQPVISSCWSCPLFISRIPFTLHHSPVLHYDPQYVSPAIPPQQFPLPTLSFPCGLSTTSLQISAQHAEVIMLCSWLKFVSSSPLPSHPDPNYFSGFPCPCSLLPSPTSTAHKISHCPWWHHHILLQPQLSPCPPAVFTWKTHSHPPVPSSLGSSLSPYPACMRWLTPVFPKPSVLGAITGLSTFQLPSHMSASLTRFRVSQRLFFISVF